MRRGAIRFLGWLLSVAAATVVGLMSVTYFSVGTADTATTPLSNDEVAAALAAVPPSAAQDPARTSASPSIAAAPSSSASSARSLSSAGGTVIAECVGTKVYLLSWSPAQGWKVDDYVRGPAPSTIVKFKLQDSANKRQVLVAVTCRGGQPQAADVEETDSTSKDDG